MLLKTLIILAGFIYYSRKKLIYGNGITSAADQENKEAIHTLGTFLYNINKKIESIPWLTKSANYGNAETQYDLAQLYFHGEENIIAQNFTEAIRLYKLAAAAGLPEAQHNLAKLYYFGEFIAQDLKESVELYHLAANKGLAKAQYELAILYYHGEVVGQDLEKAIELCRLAANQGHGEA